MPAAPITDVYTTKVVTATSSWSCARVGASTIAAASSPTGQTRPVIAASTAPRCHGRGVASAWTIRITKIAVTYGEVRPPWRRQIKVSDDAETGKTSSISKVETRGDGSGLRNRRKSVVAW